MKLILCDTESDVPAEVQYVSTYVEGNDFGEWLNAAKQEIVAFTENDVLALVTSFFVADILQLFLTDLVDNYNCTKISFIGINWFIFETNLNIEIEYIVGGNVVPRLNSLGPRNPRSAPTAASVGPNGVLFAAGNQGCHEDMAYFTNNKRAPCVYKLKGDLTIDHTDNYTSPKVLDYGAVFDGCGHTIYLTGSAPAFGGLFDLKNGTIRCLTVKVNNGAVTLAENAGWICAANAGKSNDNTVECLVDNCHTDGNVESDYAGGIVGAYAASYNTGYKKVKFTISNCSSTGNIGAEYIFYCGGICGSYAASYNTDYANIIFTISDCSSSGDIIEFSGGSGGICGLVVSYNIGHSHICFAISKCSTTGKILGSNSGGICSFAVLVNKEYSHIDFVISDCTSTGDIGTANANSPRAGIICTAVAVNSGNVLINFTINNCHSSGQIKVNNEGIISRFASGNQGNVKAICAINDCYSSGNINGTYASGIAGRECNTSNDQTAKTNVAINDCYSSGIITNTTTSYGILGIGSENCIVKNCVYNSAYNGKAGPPDASNQYPCTFGTTNISGGPVCNNFQLCYTLYQHHIGLHLLGYLRHVKHFNIVSTFSLSEPKCDNSPINFIITNVCAHKKLYVYTCRLEFVGTLHWDCHKWILCNPLAAGVYIIVSK